MKRISFVASVGAPLLLMLAACAAPQPAVRPAPAASGTSALPLAAPSSGPAISDEAVIAAALQQVRAPKTDYKLCGADLLDVTVFQQTDLNRKVRVSQNGTISFPLIGAVKVGGLSVAEAEAVMSRKLADYLVNPQVSLFITEYGNKKIFVLGEVKKPGSYDLPTESRMTVLEAISLAEGFTPVAAPDKTKVIRVADGKNQVFLIVVSDITRNGQKEKDITLEPNDVVYVPQSFF